MPTFRYAKIVDEELLNRLMALEQQNSQYCWDVGDLINEVAVQAEMSGSGYTHGDICKAFGVVLGVRAKDLRIVSGVATVFPREIREQHPILTWGHFLRAMGPKWETNLEWMESGIDDLGRPASVDAFLVSGEGSEHNDVHPAEIAKENSKKKASRVISNIQKAVKSGKLSVNDDKIEKIEKLLNAVLTLLGD